MTELSREAILAMVPGRELDALVALKVIGESSEDVFFIAQAKGPFAYDKNGFTVEWCPSTDIAAAWEVVEKITSHTDWMLYRIGHTDESGEVEYECTFLEVHRGVSGYARAKTAPEAICKAALLTTLEESK